MIDSDLREENAFIDAQDILVSLDRKLVDSDIIQYKEHGIDLYSGATWYVKNYTGLNPFVKSLKFELTKRGILTTPQARGALNVLRNELQSKPTSNLEEANHTCLVCSASFPTWTELSNHRSNEHGASGRAPVVAETGTPERVIEVQKSTLGLDLSKLPDGRYAAPDPSGKNDFIFLMVKRVRRTYSRDRRYVYGKIITGNEIVVAGTIEVKIWSSDSKELIGEQKPGETYHGKFENELQLIMMMPDPWAKLFGRLMQRCCICAKPLTDDLSRQIGMGLECEKKEAYFTTPPKYTYIGTDRPNKWQANPLDEEYRSGKRMRFVPWKPKPPEGYSMPEEDSDN